MIAGLSEEKDRRTMARTVDNLARYMRTKSYEYNPAERSKSMKWH